MFFLIKNILSLQNKKLKVMSVLSDFIIPIIGLKLGNHSYNLKVDGKFFKEFENTELENGLLEVNLVLTKRSNLMELNFHVTGYVESLCDKCGADLNLPLSYQDMRILKFSHEDFTNTDDVLILRNDEHEIDISHMVYETIALALPSRRVHNEANGQICDPELLNKIEEYLEQDKKEDVDTRWSALKNLLTDKE
jgi:uncharacterized metal-binding protein YceD (DUF177 family)